MKEHDLNTSAGGRGFVKELFNEHLGTHSYNRYIDERLAADFACALGLWAGPVLAKVAAYEAFDAMAEPVRVSTLYAATLERDVVLEQNRQLRAALEEVLVNAERGLPAPLHRKLRDLIPKAPPAPANEAERPGFEAWHCDRFKTEHTTGAPTRDFDGSRHAPEYGPPAQQFMWEAWQGRAAKCTCGGGK